MKIHITVAAPDREFRFTALVHVANSAEALHLDPVDFYQKFGGEVPAPLHHELEIIEPNEDELYKCPLHIHHSRKTERPFVCYPKRITTLWRAREIFGLWCLGCVNKIIHDINLNTAFMECDNDEKLFIETMESMGIRTTSEKIEY